MLRRSPDTVLAPDVAFVSRRSPARYGKVRDFWPAAPDLAVEVRSPGDSLPELERKARAYLAAGTRLVWIIHPLWRSASVWPGGREPARLGPDGQLDGEHVVPGFRIALADVLKDPAPAAP